MPRFLSSPAPYMPAVSVGLWMSPHLLQVHTLHRPVHALDHIRHAARDLPHRDSRLHARAHGIDARGQAQQVQILILLPNGILGVDLRNVRVALLDRLDGLSDMLVRLRSEWACVRGVYLLQLRLLRLLVLRRLRRLSVQLLRRELPRPHVSVLIPVWPTFDPRSLLFTTSFIRAKHLRKTPPPAHLEIEQRLLQPRHGRLLSPRGRDRDWER